MLKQLSVFIIAALLLSACLHKSPENAKEIQSLKTMLTESPESISNLNTEISFEESELATQIIHDYLTADLKNKYESQWQNETLELSGYLLKFKYKKFGEKPPNGWSLYISMHGGGGAPEKVNDQQWQNQIKLYEPKEGIYMAARAPTDTWNLWHQSHIDEFFALFIQLADVFEDINTNRVYLTGYSAGGDGTFQLAPRMADWLAGAAMMAGHPNDASPLGLRNLPFAIHMGAEDSAYHRNEIAAEWGAKLDELQKRDPEGFIHDIQIHEGMGHWMQRKDTAAIEWMSQYNRVAYPEKIVWKQSSVIHSRFYWLAVPEGAVQKDTEIVASRDGQNILIEKADLVSEIIINFNDEMVDLNKKVTVTYNGKVIYNDNPKRTIATIWNSLNNRNDLEQDFCAQIVVPLK
ncbi:MAG TPA: alpha/beta hydrolase [Draconibacterium sp.]|nr:alpha/beta hydrolase [Draconibacterium sp.]